MNNATCGDAFNETIICTREPHSPDDWHRTGNGLGWRYSNNNGTGLRLTKEDDEQ